MFQSVPQAVDALTLGVVLEIGPGVYRTPVVLRVPGVSIIGHGLVVFERTAAQGKAVMVIAADDTQVRNIECRLTQPIGCSGTVRRRACRPIRFCRSNGCPLAPLKTALMTRAADANQRGAAALNPFRMAWVASRSIRGPRVVTSRAEAAEARSPARCRSQPWVMP